MMSVLSYANERASSSTHSRATGDRQRSRGWLLWLCCAWCLSFTVGITERTTSCCSQDDLLFSISVAPLDARNFHIHLGSFGQFDFVYVPLDFKHCASYGFAFVYFLNSDRAEQFRNSFCMPRRASQVVGVVFCASPGARSQYSAIHEQPCDDLRCLRAIQALTPLWHVIHLTRQFSLSHSEIRIVRFRN